MKFTMLPAETGVVVDYGPASPKHLPQELVVLTELNRKANEESPQEVWQPVQFDCYDEAALVARQIRMLFDGSDSPRTEDGRLKYGVDAVFFDRYNQRVNQARYSWEYVNASGPITLKFRVRRRRFNASTWAKAHEDPTKRQTRRRS